MFEKVLDALMLVFWIGIALGLASAAAPGLDAVAHLLAWAAGNGVALLALGGTVYVLLGAVAGLARR